MGWRPPCPALRATFPLLSQGKVEAGLASAGAAVVSRWSGTSGFCWCPELTYESRHPHPYKGSGRWDGEGGRVRTGGHLVAAVTGEAPGKGTWGQEAWT